MYFIRISFAFFHFNKTHDLIFLYIHTLIGKVLASNDSLFRNVTSTCRFQISPRGGTLH